jgi:hypothetical protein
MRHTRSWQNAVHALNLRGPFADLHRDPQSLCAHKAEAMHDGEYPSIRVARCYGTERRRAVEAILASHRSDLFRNLDTNFRESDL